MAVNDRAQQAKRSSERADRRPHKADTSPATPHQATSGNIQMPDDCRKPAPIFFVESHQTLSLSRERWQKNSCSSIQYRKNRRSNIFRSRTVKRRCLISPYRLITSHREASGARSFGLFISIRYGPYTSDQMEGKKCR